MNLLQVALFTHRKIPSPLSFYSKDDISVGSILYAPLKKERVLGMVVGTSPVSENKNDIRTQTFELKKVQSKDVVHVVDQKKVLPYIQAAQRQALPYSLLFDAIIPECIKRNIEYLGNIFHTQDESNETTISYLESSSEERIAQYKNSVRDTLAKKKSVHIIAPTVSGVVKLSSIIGKGISHKTIILHGDLTKKASDEAVRRICSGEESLFIVSTPHFAFITPESLKLRIVDQESHPNYYSFDTPSVDYCEVFKSIWGKSSVKTIFADTILRIHSYKDIEEKKYKREFSVHSRFSNTIPIELLSFDKDAAFSTLTSKAHELVKKLKSSSHAFLYVARKGVHSSMQCSDCGEIVACQKCDKPTTVQLLPSGSRELRCLYCSNKEALRMDQELICTHCTSWKIKGFGITTRTVTSELKELYPDKTIYTLDGDVPEKTFKKILKTWEEEGGIIVGTDSFLPYLNRKLSLSIIISCDSWLSMPDIDTHKRLVQVLEPLLEHSQNAVFIQTRIPNDPLFEICTNENITDYIKSELKERRELSHVPYATFILIRREKFLNKKEADAVMDLFPSCRPHMYKVGSDIRVLLRVAEERFFDDEELQKKLQNLYPHLIIEVNPQTLFSR